VGEKFKFLECQVGVCDVAEVKQLGESWMKRWIPAQLHGMSYDLLERDGATKDGEHDSGARIDLVLGGHDNASEKRATKEKVIPSLPRPIEAQYSTDVGATRPR